MMNTLSIRPGATVKTILIEGVDGVSDELLIEHAMRAAGETRTSLFGTSVRRGNCGNRAVVFLYTD